MPGGMFTLVRRNTGGDGDPAGQLADIFLDVGRISDKFIDSDLPRTSVSADTSNLGLVVTIESNLASTPSMTVKSLIWRVAKESWDISAKGQGEDPSTHSSKGLNLRHLGWFEPLVGGILSSKCECVPIELPGVLWRTGRRTPPGG